MGTDSEGVSTPQDNKVFRADKADAMPTLKIDGDKIPDEIPAETVVNRHIDSVKKRRSSLRRSVNGGFSSTLRGV